MSVTTRDNMPIIQIRLEVYAKSSEDSILSTPRATACVAHSSAVGGSLVRPMSGGPTWCAPPNPGHRQ